MPSYNIGAVNTRVWGMVNSLNHSENRDSLNVIVRDGVALIQSAGIIISSKIRGASEHIPDGYYRTGDLGSLVSISRDDLWNTLASPDPLRVRSHPQDMILSPSPVDMVNALRLKQWADIASRGKLHVSFGETSEGGPWVIYAKALSALSDDGLVDEVGVFHLPAEFCFSGLSHALEIPANLLSMALLECIGSQSDGYTDILFAVHGNLDTNTVSTLYMFPTGAPEDPKGFSWAKSVALKNKATFLTPH
jgi:hypothetical protein